MKVIIAGGRDFSAPRFGDEWNLVCDLHQKYCFIEIISGGANGADRFGEFYAGDSGVPLKVFPAEWDKYGKAAGPIRNAQMAQYADAVILFPGGRGTDSMRKLAKEYGLKILYDAEVK